MIGDRFGSLYNAGEENDLNHIIDIFEKISPEKLNDMSAQTYSHFLQSYTEVQHLYAVNEMYDVLPD